MIYCLHESVLCARIKHLLLGFTYIYCSARYSFCSFVSSNDVICGCQFQSNIFVDLSYALYSIFCAWYIPLHIILNIFYKQLLPFHVVYNIFHNQSLTCIALILVLVNYIRWQMCPFLHLNGMIKEIQKSNGNFAWKMNRTWGFGKFFFCVGLPFKSVTVIACVILSVLMFTTPTLIYFHWITKGTFNNLINIYLISECDLFSYQGWFLFDVSRWKLVDRKVKTM